VALVLFYDTVLKKKPKKLQNEALTSASELVFDSFPYKSLVSLKKINPKNQGSITAVHKKNKNNHHPKNFLVILKTKSSIRHNSHRIERNMFLLHKHREPGMTIKA